MKKVKFYQCLSCGNIVYMAEDSNITPSCCGKPMSPLEAKTIENGMEKHLPVLEWIDDCTLHVSVGSILHPMEKEHRIEFIVLETKNGIQIRYICDKKEPSAVFHCSRKNTVAVYAYCNVHGFWKTDLSFYQGMM